MTTVYVTHGRKYHADEACQLMTAGEALWDFDGDDWVWTAGAFRRTVDSPRYAAACGKLPCLGCVPADSRAFPPLYGQTFGHEPVEVGGEWPNRATVCARCRTDWFGGNGRYKRYVPWPCGSAVILGLAPRSAA